MSERYQQDRAKDLGMPEGIGKRYSPIDLEMFYGNVAYAEMQREWKRGTNCPLPSICDSRIVHDGIADKFDAIIITNEQGKERAFRWVGSLPWDGKAAISLDSLNEQDRSSIEDPAKVTYMPGVVIDEEGTFGLHMEIKKVQQGGLEFLSQESVQGRLGVWEELRGNGNGAFYMFRNWDRIAASKSS